MGVAAAGAARPVVQAWPVVPKARSTERGSSCTSSTWTNPPRVNSTSASASRTPRTASSHSRRASSRPVPVAVSGFHAPALASSARSSTASNTWANRPNSRPASANGARFPGRPASTAVCANAAAVAVSVGSVTSNSETPAIDSTRNCRSTASTSTAVSNPTSAPRTAPPRSQRAATPRATAATGRRANTPSRSATWSRTFAEASTNDTAAANRAPSPTATSADRIPRNGHGPADRRAPAPPEPDCASTNAEMIKPS
ncbi:hypothetical protein AQ490_20145 [Wenjunlia vitaminophila]|uniref:Uncharacterized protein n=1 Tax=Wenjunlia vitaminophila TaxID=76728 RepID=A0A0T6LV93_WENVI|nr:hypothetical protein AQ490_20145 [Wenjunlia vitaminophila]